MRGAGAPGNEKIQTASGIGPLDLRHPCSSCPQPLCHCVSQPPRAHLAPASLSPAIHPLLCGMSPCLFLPVVASAELHQPADLRPRLPPRSSCPRRGGGRAGCTAVGAVGFFQLAFGAKDTSRHVVLLQLLRPCTRGVLACLFLLSWPQGPGLKLGLKGSLPWVYSGAALGSPGLPDSPTSGKHSRIA